MKRPVQVSRRRSAAQWLAPLALCLLPTAASASFLSGEAADTAAMYIAWFAVTVVPVGLIVLFWKLHVLPEKIAEKRHHPQKDAIHVLCLLSLAFGGLLWPVAWLWAYTKPITHHLAYGTERHDSYFHEMADRLEAGELSDEDMDEILEELDAMAAKSRLSARLKALRSDLIAARTAPELATTAEGRA